MKGATLDKSNKTKVKETFTVDSPIPYEISELLSKLKEDNTSKGISAATGKPVAGEWENKLTRFISRLEAKLDDRRYGFMFAPPKEALGRVDSYLSHRIVAARVTTAR